MRLSLLFPFVLYLLFSGCKGKDEPIPAYLHIDSTWVVVTSGQGNAIHDIKGGQVFANGEFLGVFEFPATIPVLQSGKVTITVAPMVRLNASGERLWIYSSILPSDSVIDLEVRKTKVISSFTLHYRSNTTFPWIEDFEDNSSTLIGINVPKGDTSYLTTGDFELNGKYTGTSKMYSAIISPSDTAKYLDLGSFKNFDFLPSDGRDVIMEFDLKCDVDVQLAINRISPTTGPQYVPFLAIYATGNNWKRVYANIAYETGGQPDGTEYQILFSANFPPSSETRKIQIDNIRLSYNN